jgi:hypothetical protein
MIHHRSQLNIRAFGNRGHDAPGCKAAKSTYCERQFFNGAFHLTALPETISIKRITN